MNRTATKPKLYMGRPMGSWIFMVGAAAAIIYLLFFSH